MILHTRLTWIPIKTVKNKVTNALFPPSMLDYNVWMVAVVWKKSSLHIYLFCTTTKISSYNKSENIFFGKREGLYSLKLNIYTQKIFLLGVTSSWGHISGTRHMIWMVMWLFITVEHFGVKNFVNDDNWHMEFINI